MDDRTLKALRGSIKKWEGIVAGTMHDEADANCPLCLEFKRDQCVGCPVSAKAGRKNCNNTPYLACILAEDNYGDESEEYRRAAQAELDFLKSLLPQESAQTAGDDR